MLLVPTYISDSKIGGFGVFAGRDIRKGELIWKYHPKTVWVITNEEMNALPQGIREMFRTYSYQTDGKWYYCSDNSKFMNHSDDPNTKEDFTGDDTNPMGRDSATRNIAMGEELTCNYKLFDENWKIKLGSVS
ncbi:SET domain-containing protein-lysine N-methyltransferase [Leptospira gomenensis]|uniref:SET domain-containing protein-lysine N-methyltransferase n=1 Tax=Leptospira gomenensis TaxID=2484974 RepID=A0A5F1YPU4_9LEPT|nr:SET domain-containing protein [Leptospira gomenensis]TGK28123.1 SET domain-containing protein-lysine N-methyltransferase [Leptospira gomenensis]TGK37021.1 SET domain-containing protein-lysine N-methyltransferase [Leptospira gomenensis]TGK45657.1 SET domain-containing protein-lysine N-methyltransferase [Leptospira gomenensis]TGK59596.1 SET domain-containing protein-lysine N-methyltransferase [Leptospira gomenensis]